MDDSKIQELYSIPDEEKTDSQAKLDIQTRESGSCYIPCTDAKMARRVNKILGEESAHNHYNSQRIQLRRDAKCWAVIKLEQEGITVRYEAEDYDYGDNYPDNWNILRRAVYHKDEYTCQECGATDTELHAHHQNHIEDGGSHKLRNLTTLCNDCHEDYHGFEI